MFRSRVKSLTLTQNFTSTKISQTAGLDGLIRTQYLPFLQATEDKRWDQWADGHRHASQYGGGWVGKGWVTILRVGIFSNETKRRKTYTLPLGSSRGSLWREGRRRWNQLLGKGVICSWRGMFLLLWSCPEASVLKACWWKDTMYILKYQNALPLCFLRDPDWAVFETIYWMPFWEKD